MHTLSEPKVLIGRYHDVFDTEKNGNQNNNEINILPYSLPFLSDFIIFAIILRNTIYGNLGHIHKNKTSRYAIVDVEVGLKDHKIHDIGALRQDGATFHKASKEELFDFLRDTDYLCGHNIIHHDAQYLFSDKACRWTLVDTLYVSPLLFRNVLTIGW